LTADFLVVGGGVVGVTIALEIKRRHPDLSVVLLEKEPRLGLHASGRNSGVLHAGFYYTEDSMKAKLTRDGNREMKAFCEDRGIRVNHCGKVVVAKGERDLAGIAELLRRGAANRVDLQEIDAKQAAEIEPRVKTHQKAIYSPTTSTLDPEEVMGALAEEARRLGIEIRTETAYEGRIGRAVKTSRGPVEAGYVVNAAGLYADVVARDFGFGMNLRVLPFKGLYLYSDEPPGALRTNLYPVPDLRNPFLGVHFTVTVDGHVKIGPTAIPCLWREQYGGTSRFRARELGQMVRIGVPLFFRAGFDFRALAFEEVRKYWKPHLVKQAGALAEGVTASQYRRWGRPGIRAQLVDVRRRALVMDFHLEGDEQSMHVLNAVSPAFTCSFPFARTVCDRIEQRG
jgi:L-2-hydroxyglutarate oxidase LhgO